MIAIPILIIILAYIACSLEIEGRKNILKFLSIISILILLSVVIGSCKIINSNIQFKFNIAKSFETFLIIIFIIFIIFVSADTDDASATLSLLTGIVMIASLIIILLGDKIPTNKIISVFIKNKHIIQSFIKKFLLYGLIIILWGIVFFIVFQFLVEFFHRNHK